MVRRKVLSGQYKSASEVIREALRLMEEQERSQAIKFDRLRQDIQDGLNSGPAMPWKPEEIKRAGRKRRASRASRNHKWSTPEVRRRCRGLGFWLTH
jgi:antitoxin ParD1/3/4